MLQRIRWNRRQGDLKPGRSNGSDREKGDFCRQYRFASRDSRVARLACKQYAIAIHIVGTVQLHRSITAQPSAWGDSGRHVGRTAVMTVCRVRCSCGVSGGELAFRVVLVEGDAGGALSLAERGCATGGGHVGRGWARGSLTSSTMERWQRLCWSVSPVIALPATALRVVARGF